MLVDLIQDLLRGFLEVKEWGSRGPNSQTHECVKSSYGSGIVFELSEGHKNVVDAARVMNGGIEVHESNVLMAANDKAKQSSVFIVEKYEEFLIFSSQSGLNY